MAVSTADYNRTHQESGFQSIPVTASTKIYKGSIVMALIGTGYALNGADTALGVFQGVAIEQADNSSGSAGDIDVKTQYGTIEPFVCSGAAQTWVGKNAYCSDDSTVALVASVTNNVLIGKFVEYVSATEMKVLTLSEGEIVKLAQVHTLDITTLRAADGAALAIAETAGDHFLHIGTNFIALWTEVANNETETSISTGEYTLPWNYISGSAITLRVRMTVEGDGTSNVSTVDINAYKQTDGAVGSDLCTTAAQEITEDAYGNYDFVVTPTGFVPGEKIHFKLTTAIIESATDVLNGKIDKIQFLFGVKG